MKVITHSNQKVPDETRRLEEYIVGIVNNFPPIENRTRVGSAVDWAIWIMECQNKRIVELEELRKELQIAAGTRDDLG